MKKISLLFLFLSLVNSGYAQTILLTGDASERIIKACNLIKLNAPDIYESMVGHSIIRPYEHHTGNRFFSTYTIENDNFWILISPGSLYERSINRLAGTIFHESLHMLLELQRARAGEIRRFSDLSENEKKQEEIFIYKKTRELLVRLNTSSWEIDEYDSWASAYY